MSEVAALLAAFHEATGREAAIWEQRDPTSVPTPVASSSAWFADVTELAFAANDVQSHCELHALHALPLPSQDGSSWMFTSASTTRVAVGAPVRDDDDDTHAEADRVLARALALVRRLERERDGATNELGGRYEEISLLYAIGELLGGTPSVESVADTLLRELAITVGATRAVFLLTHGTSGSAGILAPIATLGLGSRAYPVVSLADEAHIAVRAFRSGNACTEEGVAALRADEFLAEQGGALMAVAITRPSTGVGITGQYQAVVPRRSGQPLAEHATVPLGVLVLSGRATGAPFNAGDRKLATAVGTQVGIALHNASLVRTAMERQQLMRELRLAHELQLKLLPKPNVVAPEARAAARVVPAESVGGDFYLLARLDAGRTAVLIGDVSGHGYQAALVMALSLSAAAIHVQAAFDPAIALEAVRRSLADELSSTDMSLSLCYALIDEPANTLRYANAGHPHAFRMGSDGKCVRLTATVPPLGFSDAPIEDACIPWRSGDRLVLFTDGITDARDDADVRLGEDSVLACLSAIDRSATPDMVLDALFAHVDAHVRGTPLRDDLAVVIVDRPR